jgi:hypothetical protein
MKIISAHYANGNQIPVEQQKKDMEQLQKLHSKCCVEDPTWSIFGGVLTIEKRSYQIAP